jgi:glycerol kinase
MGKNTYGTGSFVLLNSGFTVPEPPPGVLATAACAVGESRAYALEASIFVTGAAVQWLRDGLQIIERAEETEALAASLQGNDGVYFVPALTGLVWPEWGPACGRSTTCAASTRGSAGASGAATSRTWTRTSVRACWRAGRTRWPARAPALDMAGVFYEGWRRMRRSNFAPAAR